MDNDILILPQMTQGNGNIKRWAFCIIAVLLTVASTVLAVVVLQPPSSAIDFNTLSSPDDIKEGEVYLINDMLSSGIFMYMGDADQKGVPRTSGKGIYLEKEYVYSYHTLALIEGEDGALCLTVFSVNKKDGELFDAVAEHDKKENQNGDPGSSLPLSVYVKAKRLGGEANAAFTKSKAEHSSAPGMEKVDWVYYEMEYYCDADESYTALATKEKREWLKVSFGVLPIAAFLLFIGLKKPRATENLYTEETEEEKG